MCLSSGMTPAVTAKSGSETIAGPAGWLCGVQKDRNDILMIVLPDQY